MAAVAASPGPLGFITINVDPVLHLGPAADPLVRGHVRARVPRRVPVRRAAVRDAAWPPQSRRREDHASGRSSSDCSAAASTTSSSSRTSGRTTSSHPINIIAFWQGGHGLLRRDHRRLRRRSRSAPGGTATTPGSRSTAACSSPSSASRSGASATSSTATSSARRARCRGRPRTRIPTRSCRPVSASARLAVHRVSAGRGVRGARHDLIGVILYLLLRRNVRAGVLAIAYVALYAVSQLILFEFRASEPPGPLGLARGAVDVDRDARDRGAGALRPLATDHGEIREARARRAAAAAQERAAVR